MRARTVRSRSTPTSTSSSTGSARTRSASPAATPRATPTASRTSGPSLMHGLWPWILLGLLGAYHGLNPAMGWLFAVALGMQEGDRRAVLRALPPIGVGHEGAIGVAAGLGLGLGVFADTSALKIGAGAPLVAFGVFRFVKPRAHFRWVRARVN